MKTVLITGAAGGIGSATAKVFAREGWQVFGVDKVAPEDLCLYKDFFVIDLADESQIKALFEDLDKQVSGLNSLVNNAAIQLCTPLLETTREAWDGLMAVNLRAAFLVMKQAHPLLCVRKGSIVNVGSVHARATSENIAAYAASKGGLESLTQAAALEFADDGIRVNGVHPGAVATKMLETGLNRGHLNEGPTDKLLAQLGQKHPVGRVAQPSEIGEVIFFLADEDRSSFVTGTFLTADGGALGRLSTE